LEYRAARYDGTSTTPVGLSEISADSDCVWVQLRILDPAAAENFFSKELALPPNVVGHLVRSRPVSELERVGQLYFFNLRFYDSPGVEEPREIHALLGAHVLVTITDKNDACPFDSWFDRWIARSAQIGKTSALIFFNLLDDALDRQFPVLDAFEDRIDELEDRLYSDKPVEIREFLSLKQNLNEHRRLATALRDAVNRLLYLDAELVRPEERAFIQEAYQLALRVIERIEINRDMLSDLLDAQQNVAANKLNQSMRTMTVISTVLMTVSLVTGWYGMNFKHMPELERANGYPLVVLVIGVLVLIEPAVFRKQGWLGKR
jgi:magnesium transporter